MAFTQSTFATVGAQAAPSPTVYSYSTSDAVPTVTAANYFAAKAGELDDGDIIMAVIAGQLLTLKYDASLGLAATTSLIHRIPVTKASDLAGTLLSTHEYFIDGVVDMGSQSIEIPAGGLNLTGFDFDVSKLISSAAGYTLFTSPGGGSGDFLGRDFAIEVTGATSKVYDITSVTGNEAVEIDRVNFNDCTSLGTITGYRQGLETGTGRFGGVPELTLAGTWAGGYFIETSIVRALSAGMTGALYMAGAGFTMASRFRSNQNIDLPASASFVDFAPSNFTNPSTLQFSGCIVSRNGVIDAGDSNLTPNIASTDLASAWDNNQGLNNTFPGGTLTISGETATVISMIGTAVDMAGTYTPSDLQHFDEPSNGQLRHLGTSPREYRIVGDLVVDGTANNQIAVKVVKWDNSASGFVDVATQIRQINSLAGVRDVAFFTITMSVTLDQNDYVKLQLINNTSTDNLTAEIDSFYTLLGR